MANNVQSYNGPYSLIYENLKGVVVDVVKGGTRGFRRQKEGIAKVLAEVASGIPVYAAAIGVPSDLDAKIATLTSRIDEVRAARIVVDKFAEVLEETEAYLEDEREGLIASVVDAVRNTARRKDPTVLASFEETVRYYGQVGYRAYKTRLHKEKSEEGEPADEPAKPDAEPTQTAPTQTAPAIKPAPVVAPATPQTSTS